MHCISAHMVINITFLHLPIACYNFPTGIFLAHSTRVSTYGIYILQL